jgi:hypothetical protein
LQNNALGTLKDSLGRKVELDSNQVKSIEILLRKAMPDLSATDSKVTMTSKPAHELSDDELVPSRRRACRIPRRLAAPKIETAAAYLIGTSPIANCAAETLAESGGSLARTRNACSTAF